MPTNSSMPSGNETEIVHFHYEHVAGYRAPELTIHKVGELRLCCYEAKVFEVREEEIDLFENGRIIKMTVAYPHLATAETAGVARELIESYLNEAVPPDVMALHERVCAQIARKGSAAPYDNLPPEKRYQLERWHHAIQHQKKRSNPMPPLLAPGGKRALGRGGTGASRT